MTDRESLLSRLMLAMPERHRARWCNPGEGCGCMGCANMSGGLLRHGFTREDYDRWMAANAPPNTPALAPKDTP